jgi:hypothetical protein
LSPIRRTGRARARRDPRGGLAAHAELTVRLALDTGNLGAAGFRLAVLAAPR